VAQDTYLCVTFWLNKYPSTHSGSHAGPCTLYLPVY